MSKTIRLDKYLSDMTSETRSKVKEYIRKGRITANGVVIKTPETKVDTESDEICIDGKQVGYVEYYYYMMNKPQGVITSTEKGKTKTVMDVFKETEVNCPRFDELSPVGRLDKDTEGLLLITNDGELNHKLLSPKNHVDKVYYAELRNPVKASDIEIFSSGLDLGDFICKPAKLEICDSENKFAAKITISEGKFHQVKRMFEAVENEVMYLKRLSMGSLVLDKNLQLGEVRELTVEEIIRLKEI
ncbi:MAG: pseudouridine synthase [Catonella sp.]|uniref:pseudouridine synthase n=1 Tax=Catonella sp. TaxID=2382125 RepID=UPI003FA01B8A